MPATAVNKAREAYAGGEQKSDKRDAFVIADHLRLRWRSFSEVRSRRSALGRRTSPNCGRWSPTGGIWCRTRPGA